MTAFASLSDASPAAPLSESLSDPKFLTARIYRGSRYGARHPLSIQRVPVVTDLVRALGWDNGAILPSPRAKPAALMRYHTAAHVAAVQAAEDSQTVSDAVRRRHGLGTLSNPLFAEMFRRPATAVGGGLLAADLVTRGGAVFNPGGGQHHGLADAAAGFCYFNEPVLTILRLLDMGLTRVAYVDIDAHHGDGVELAFAADPRVRMISIHEARRWPFTGRRDDTGGGSAINLPVAAGFHDSAFDLVLTQLIGPAVAQFRPQAIFLQCGVDALAEDPLSRLALSNNSHAAAVRAMKRLSPRLIVSGGGGYNPWTVGRAWAMVWAALAGYTPPGHLPPAAETIQRGLHWHRKGRPSEVLLTTLQDAPRCGPVPDALRWDVDHLRQRLGL